MSGDGNGEPLPEEIDWWIHRVATSDVYSDPLHVIQWQWTIDDLLDAHIVLDAYHRARKRADAK